MELGFSALLDRDPDFRREADLFGVDLESRQGPLGLRGEYLHRDNRVAGIKDWGWYLSTDYEWPGRGWYAYLRYGQWVTTPRRVGRATVCLGYRLAEVAVLKLEYSHHTHRSEAILEAAGLDYRPQALIAQAAVTF